jgi:hypothetical protein
MTGDQMNQFLQGALVMGCMIIALFFLRFWRKSHDRLFLFFSAAFWTMAVDWGALSFTNADEPNTALFIVRLLAFVLIVIGILDKNRSSNSSESMTRQAVK